MAERSASSLWMTCVARHASGDFAVHGAGGDEFRCTLPKPLPMAASRKSRQKFVRAALLAAAECAAFVLLLAPTRAFRFLETGTYDVRARFTARRTPADPRIVIIDVDNASFETLKENFGRWPWTRAVWAATARYVAAGKPQAIVFDAIYSAQETPQVDADFAAAIHAAGNVVLGFSLDASDLAGAGQEADAKQRAALVVR